jgi:hypothetical protein
MDGIGVPIAGALLGVVLLLACLTAPKLRRFALAALVSPFLSSIVFIAGSFVLSDMNPAAEYGSSYVPTRREHDPTKGEVALWIASVVATFLLSAFVCVNLQRVSLWIVQRIGFSRPGIRKPL